MDGPMIDGRSWHGLGMTRSRPRTRPGADPRARPRSPGDGRLQLARASHAPPRRLTRAARTAGCTHYGRLRLAIRPLTHGRDVRNERCECTDGARLRTRRLGPLDAPVHIPSSGASNVETGLSARTRPPGIIHGRKEVDRDSPFRAGRTRVRQHPFGRPAHAIRPSARFQIGPVTSVRSASQVAKLVTLGPRRSWVGPDSSRGRSTPAWTGRRGRTAYRA